MTKKSELESELIAYVDVALEDAAETDGVIARDAGKCGGATMRPKTPAPCFGCEHPNAWKARKELFDTFNVENAEAWHVLNTPNADPNAWKAKLRPPDNALPLSCCRRA
jgi:hypothetical protein